MERPKKRKIVKSIGWLFVSLIVLFTSPYLIPISQVSATLPATPFQNSSFHEIHGTFYHHRIFKPQDQLIQGKILLLHGMGGSTYSFEKVAPLIAEAGYFVLLVDLPGFGYSQRKLDYDHSQHHRAKELWNLLAWIDEQMPPNEAQRTWHLAGHSMGGGTVFSMGLQEPSRAASLILIDGALFDPVRGQSFFQFPPVQQWLKVALEHFFIKENRIRNFLRSAYGQEPAEEAIEAYLKPLQLPGTAASLVQVVLSAQSEDMHQLQDLKLPLFALWGGQDDWVPLSKLKELQDLRPDMTTVLIDQAAHCPMETHPEEFIRALLGWLN